MSCRVAVGGSNRRRIKALKRSQIYSPAARMGMRRWSGIPFDKPQLRLRRSLVRSEVDWCVVCEMSKHQGILNHDETDAMMDHLAPLRAVEHSLVSVTH
ncbi:hypothetical protein JQ616_32900 [Bradyrhizobium tropiciagri]|uniref:hypothetical protein n=1 Tax=Bradyrhizobium tropiciagri TaxID=312253 RepID=UPI001BAAF5CE|nr:hypothetical protein [Bradyrhizobium tropiciagri]MBR0899777.1 hypothetical protein [Bradyrhizobium tropiciagri]